MVITQYICSGGQFSPSVWPHNPATGFRPPSATVVSDEPFSHRTGTLWCLQKEMATYRHWSVSLWRDPDDVSHCQILSPDKTEWRLISDADEDAVLWLTSYGSWNAYEKKYIWTRRHIYDNLHVLSTDDANMFTRKQYHTTWTLITDVRLQTISLTNLDYTSFSRAACSTCVVGNLMGHWELHTQWPEYF